MPKRKPQPEPEPVAEPQAKLGPSLIGRLINNQTGDLTGHAKFWVQTVNGLGVSTVALGFLGWYFSHYLDHQQAQTDKFQESVIEQHKAIVVSLDKLASSNERGSDKMTTELEKIEKNQSQLIGVLKLLPVDSEKATVEK